MFVVEQWWFTGYLVVVYWLYDCGSLVVRLWFTGCAVVVYWLWFTGCVVVVYWLSGCVVVYWLWFTGVAVVHWLCGCRMEEVKPHKRSGSQPVRELASRSAQTSVMSPVKSSKVQGSMSANNTSVAALSSKRALRQVAGTASSIKR